MKVIIVDDEPKALELLEGYVSKIKELKLLASFRNGINALQFLKENYVDVVFLDIEMPFIDGISFSQLVSDSVKIVFTTAYSDYAVESYELDAFDYLLKPITFLRFAKSIDKILSSINKNQKATSKGHLYIKSGYDLYRVDEEEILYLEKESNYMTYFLESKKILARESITNALLNLSSNFIQVHKSYIVNVNKIEKVNNDGIYIGNFLVPLGAKFRASFEKIVTQR